VTRFVDRGAVVAAGVGAGVAVTVGVSFLLIIPIDPVVWLLALPSGALIGYYANVRSGRQGGPWPRIVVNGLVAATATALTSIVLMFAVKALFFAADDGYRDPGLGGRIDCVTGADCVYRRYLEAQPGDLTAAGVADAASFARYYWDQQVRTSELVAGLTLSGGLAGAITFAGRTRPSRAA
jgi:hypothetical protein